jgi:hypothetical protein
MTSQSSPRLRPDEVALFTDLIDYHERSNLAGQLDDEFAVVSVGNDGDLTAVAQSAKLSPNPPIRAGILGSEHSARKRETWKAAALRTELLPLGLARSKRYHSVRAPGESCVSLNVIRLAPSRRPAG